MVNNQRFNDDEMWNVGEIVFTHLLFALGYTEISARSGQVLGQMTRPG